MNHDAGGYRVRIESGDFFSVEEGDGDQRDELFTLKEAISAAEDFIGGTQKAVADGHLQCAYSLLDLEIVSSDGDVMSIEDAKACLAKGVECGK